MINSKPYNVLVLDYNTIKLQTFGFVEMVEENGLESNMRSLNHFSKVTKIINHPNKNGATLFDNTISESEYFKLIKRDYTYISTHAPVTGLFSVINTLSLQRFVGTTFIGSYSDYPIDFGGVNRIQRIFFDIFNIDEIEKFIVTCNINAIFVDDISIISKLIENKHIKLSGMTFMCSMLGYNLTVDEITKHVTDIYPHIAENAEKLDYKFGLVDLYNETMKDMFVVPQF